VHKSYYSTTVFFQTINGQNQGGEVGRIKEATFNKRGEGNASTKRKKKCSIEGETGQRERKKERTKKKQLESTKTEEIALRYFITTVQLTSDYKYNQQRNATKIHICQKNGPKMKK